MTAIWEDMANSAVEKITRLKAENQRLNAELGSMKTAIEIMCSRKPGAAANVVREDYPEIAAIIDGAFERELQAANLAHEQCAWAAGQIERVKAALDEVLASACPNAKEHHTMFAAWEKAKRLL